MSYKSGIFQKVREQAQKVSHLGARSLQKVTQDPIEKVQAPAISGQVVEGQAHQRDAFDLDYQDIQQLFRHQFPAVTRQVFGKRYNTLNKVSRFVLPNGMDQAADEILELLSEFASQIAATERVLAETGCKEIHELQKDVKRSQRAGHALKEVNKIIAAVQGAVSGMTGLVGAAADLPISVILSLKTIYEIGHAYGFELDNEEDQQAVYHALAQADLSLIAEKQAIFLGLRSLKSIFNTGDYSQLQSFLNSNYSFEQFNTLLTDADGSYKWSGLNVLGKFKVLRFATPIIGGAIGAVYSIKLIDEVAGHADEIFSYARQYLTEQKDEDIAVLEAYQRGKAQHETVSGLAVNDVSLLLDQAKPQDLHEVEQQKAAQQLKQNDTIVEVSIIERKDVVEPDHQSIEQQVQQGLETLAKENVVAEPVGVQQPALKQSVQDDIVPALADEIPVTKPTSSTRRKTTAKTTTANQASVKETSVKSTPAKRSTRTRAVKDEVKKDDVKKDQQ